jgi:hypothetical protein
MTPAEFLSAYADFAKAFPFDLQSPGGPALHDALHAFLKESANNREDAIGDLILLVARAIVAFNMAEHGGRPCPSCLQHVADRLAGQLNTEVESTNEALAKRGTH